MRKSITAKDKVYIFVHILYTDMTSNEIGSNVTIATKDAKFRSSLITLGNGRLHFKFIPHAQALTVTGARKHDHIDNLFFQIVLLVA